MAAVSVASRPIASAMRASSASVPPRPSGRCASRTSAFNVRSILETFMIQSIPRSWRKEPWLTVHPPSQLAEEVLLGHHDVAEEDLVEVGMVLIGQLGQRAARDARCAHVNEDHADAAVLGLPGIGADVAHAVVGLVGPRGPHFLPVHHEVAVPPLGSRGERGEVAAHVGLAHAEAPRDLALQGRQDETLLLVLGPELHDGGGANGEALRVERAWHQALGDDLEVGHLLLGGRVAATELGWPPRHQVARLEQLPLEGAGPLGQVGRRPPEARHEVGRRQVLVQPRLELTAEGEDRFVRGQPHGQL